MVALVLLLSCAVEAVQLDSAYVARIRQGIDLTFIDHYGEARALFRQMIQRDPSDHAAFLLLAGVHHAEMIDAEDYSQKREFAELIDTAMVLAEQALEQGRDSAWAELTIGNAHGYFAAFEGKAGSWWQAIKRGMKAKNHWLKALELDPTLYDAYLGLGNYHYYKSAKTEFINWLPFVKDRKNEGVNELQLAVDSSFFSGTMAQNSLVWIHYDRGEPTKALELAQDLHDRYPASRMALWGLAFAAYSSRQYRLAISCFGEITGQLESMNTNYFNLIECRYHRAQLFKRLHLFDEAEKECRLILALDLPEETRERQKDKLKESEKLLKELQKER